MFTAAFFALDDVSAGRYFDMCLKKDTNACGNFFSRDNGTPIHDAPDGRSQARWHANSGLALGINWRQTRSAGKGEWARVNNGTTFHSGWVRVDNIAGYGDFKKVVDCWQIKELTDDDDRLGDFILTAEFSRNGKGRITSEGGRHVHIWHTRGLVLIGRAANADSYVYGYDNKTNTVTHPIHTYALQVKLAERDAGACSSGVVTR